MSRKLSSVLIPKLTAFPQRVPKHLEASIRHVLRLNLNDKRVDTVTKEQCMQLVSTLALESANANFVLNVLQDLDDTFEYIFEGEELYSDDKGGGKNSGKESGKGKHTGGGGDGGGGGKDGKPGANRGKGSNGANGANSDGVKPGGSGGGKDSGKGKNTARALHTHLLHALFRVLGRQFGAIDLLELSRGRTDLAVVAAVDALDGALHLVDAQTPDAHRLRYHGCRLLFELTTPVGHHFTQQVESVAYIRTFNHE